MSSVRHACMHAYIVTEKVVWLWLDADSCKSGVRWLYCGDPAAVCGGIVSLSLLWEHGLEEIHRNSNQAHSSKSIIIFNLSSQFSNQPTVSSFHS